LLSAFVETGACGTFGTNAGMTVYTANLWKSYQNFLHELGHSFGAMVQSLKDYLFF